ncbi:hypothetical protein QBC39DRAFT_362008 [Podospora conica]|nr:hypothetical protein QBC39DRAFT_362008 [Schizothecium conicum]
MNVRLVRALEYISNFDIQILHKPGRFHTIPDALSRLLSGNNVTNPGTEGGLDFLPDDVEEY